MLICQTKLLRDNLHYCTRCNRILPKEEFDKQECLVPQGYGDTIKYFFERLGITGWTDCGCTKRRRFLNRMFPYQYFL